MSQNTVERTPFTKWVSNTQRTCVEYERKFDLMNEDDAAEWHYGHDCEV
jgi:hypothetical protein